MINFSTFMLEFAPYKKLRKERSEEDVYALKYLNFFFQTTNKAGSYTIQALMIVFRGYFFRVLPDNGTWKK